jgi:hypothetical protein
MFRVQTVKNQSIMHQFWVSLNLSNNSYKVSDFLNPVHLIAISEQKEALLRLLLNWEVKKKKKQQQQPRDIFTQATFNKRKSIQLKVIDLQELKQARVNITYWNH